MPQDEREIPLVAVQPEHDTLQRTRRDGSRILRVIDKVALLFPSARSSWSYAFLAFIVSLIPWQGFPSAWAQNQTSDVHIQPRVAPTRDRLGDRLESGLNPPTQPIRASVDLVLVPVTVTDPMNRLVTGLGSENFVVYEDKQPQQIKILSCEDVPVSLGVILDVSGSMVTKIDLAREAVLQFLKTSNPQDEFFIVTFADKPEELSDFTQSIKDIQGKLVYAVSKGRTALLDAIYLGISKMQQAKYPKKSLLIISDGGDNHSRYTEAEIKSVVKEADLFIYAIGIYDRYMSTPEEQLGPALLSDLTELTGGRSFTLDNPNDLPIVADRIGVELRNQYMVGYRPENRAHDGKWRKIKVRLRLPKGWPPLYVRNKSGYYAFSR